MAKLSHARFQTATMSSVQPRQQQTLLNPRTTHYEFMGPVGALFMTLGLPTVVYGLYFLCNKDSCQIYPLRQPQLPPLKEFWHPLAFIICVGWFVANAIVYLTPVGKTIQGTQIRNGTRLTYRINALYAFILSHIFFVLAYCYYKLDAGFVYRYYLSFATSAILLSLILSVYLYARSFRTSALLALGGNSGNFFYDFFIGRELNPRIGNFDWKFFCELRPGLIGWTLINYCMLAAQWEKYGYVSNSMILVCIFQAWYVFDALVFEEAILTTMDIVHDGFGFMLAFGDLAWVPFTYSLQARYLVDHPNHLSWISLAGIIALKFCGYYVFRSSNSQKDQFRRDPLHPSVKNLKTLPTKKGSRLLISGWWGMCRHPNYVGDLMMALSWCLPCGFDNVLPYFYFIYFAVLLIHRQLRDEDNCLKKYGDDWKRYCNIVRWRLLPGIY